MDKMKIAKMMVFFGIVMIAAGGALFYMNKDVYFKADVVDSNDNSNAQNNNQSVESTVIEPVSVTTYSGIYQKDGVTVKLFGYNDKLDYNVFGGPLEFHDKTALAGNTFSADGLCNFTLNAQNINLECVEPSMSGVYEKTGTYDIVSYYTDNVGDTSLVNTKYFGEYDNGTYKIVMYQSSDNTVNITIYSNDSTSYFDYVLSIVSENELHFEDEELSFNVSLTEEALNIVSDNESFSLMVGSYSKLRVMTIESVVEFKLA